MEKNKIVNALEKLMLEQLESEQTTILVLTLVKKDSNGSTTSVVTEQIEIRTEDAYEKLEDYLRSL